MPPPRRRVTLDSWASLIRPEVLIDRTTAARFTAAQSLGSGEVVCGIAQWIIRDPATDKTAAGLYL